MLVVNEKSGREFQASFESHPGAPAVPGTVHWRLRCATNDQTLQDWTAVAYEIVSDNGGISAVKSTIEIPGRLNAIIDRANLREIRELDIVADKDMDREYSETTQYYVVRMGKR